MPLDFPNSPYIGQIWVASNGITYVWDGTKWSAQPPGGASGVQTFNTRTGNVTLLSGDVTTALSGSTLTGPLYWTSSGGTTSRSAQDRTAELINVKDFGAKGDGSTDDTAAFNAAIATGHMLFVPRGAFMIRPITLNQGMFGEGMSTTIVRAAPGTPANAALITQNDSGPSSIKDMTIDGSNLAVYGVFLPSTNPRQAGLRFTGLEIENIASSAATPSPLPAGIWCDVNPAQLTYKQAIVISGCYIHDIFGDGIYIAGTGCVVANNTIVNTASAGISCADMIDGVISGNTCYNVGTQPNITADGISGYGYTNLRVLIIGNTVDTSQDHGIHFGGNNIQIVGNKVYNVANYGIILQSSPNASPTPGANGIIANNEIDTTVGGGGIRCGWFSRVTVTGNTVSNIAAGAPQGVNASSGLTFIYSNDCVASGNIINTTAGYGVYADAALNLLVSGNRCNGTAGQAIYDDGGLSTGMTAFGNVITSEGTATAAAFSGAISLRNPITVGGAATIAGAVTANAGLTSSGPTTLLPPTNWSGQQMVMVGTTSGGGPGMLFLNPDSTAPGIGFYRYASNLYISYGTASADTADIGFFSPAGLRILLGLVVSGTSQFAGAAAFQTVGFNGTAAIAKPTVTGATAGNLALRSVIAALAAYGLITDNSSA